MSALSRPHAEPSNAVIAGPPPTGPARLGRPDDRLRGVTRQSTPFVKNLLAKKMDPRVKPAGDTSIQNFVRRIAALVIASAALLAPASAQPYPTRTVEIVVSYGPGGSTDLVARAVAQKLQE